MIATEFHVKSNRRADVKRATLENASRMKLYLLGQKGQYCPSPVHVTATKNWQHYKLLTISLRVWDM